MQWLVVLVPGLLVVGDLVAMAWGLEAGRAHRLFAEVVGAHRHGPDGPGPVWPPHARPGRSVLGFVGGHHLAPWGSGPASVYGAMAIGGALMALLGFTGLAARLGRLYTPAGAGIHPDAHRREPGPGHAKHDLCQVRRGARAGGAPFLFTMVLSGLILWSQLRLKGLLGASMIVVGMLVGSVVYYAIGMGPFPGWHGTGAVGFSLLPDHGLSFELPVVAAFLICYLALISNELGTLESLGHILELGDMKKRVNRSVSVGGLSCVAAAFGGTLGPGDLCRQPRRGPGHP